MYFCSWLHTGTVLGWDPKKIWAGDMASHHLPSGTAKSVAVRGPSLWENAVNHCVRHILCPLSKIHPSIQNRMFIGTFCCRYLVAKSCPTFATLQKIVAHQAPLSVGFPKQESWSGLPFPSPGIFPTQGSNPGLLLCRWILYCVSHQRSPIGTGKGVLKTFKNIFLESCPVIPFINH